MNKRIMCFLLSFTLLFSLMGCTDERKVESEYQIYYLNMDKTKIVAEGYNSSGATGEALVEEMLQQLCSAPVSSQLRQTIPTDVVVNSFKINGGYLYVDMSKKYTRIPKTEEILIRAAIAKTLLQVEECSLISFTIDTDPFRTPDGELVGVMSADSFVENPGKQINTTEETSLTLYFASEDGTKLRKESRKVRYSTNVSMEKLIMEQLMEGPKKSGSKATIPAEAKLITISVVDGVCYVNMDEGFQNQNQEILEEVVLYSIVNSLAESTAVSKVQISINGDTKSNVRFTYPLSKMYERDNSWVSE